MEKTVVRDYEGRDIEFYSPSITRLFYPKTDEATALYPRIRRSREDGEKDLIGIAEKDCREVAWLYSEDSGEWYCISYPQKGSAGGIRTLGFDFSQLGRKLTHYHTHPEGPNLYENLIQAERLKQRFELGYVDEKKADATVRKHIRVSNALPSQQDIESMRGLLAGAKAEISFGIATPIGITDLDWDPETKIDTGVLSSLWFASIHNMEDIHDPDGQLSEGEYVQKLMEEIDRDLRGSKTLNKVSIAFRPSRANPVLA